MVNGSNVAIVTGYSTDGADQNYLNLAVVAGSFDYSDPITLEYYSGGVDQTTGEPLSTGSGANPWTSDANIKKSSTQLETALSTLRTESSKLSANLSVVTTRQDFTNNMISTLQTGADNLTLADTNEEGANMLMLQTRQNLGITSLSMASQAAQAVLRLF